MRMATLDPETKAALFDIPHLMIGGEALPLSLAKELAGRPRGDLTNMYGPTETTVWSATYRFPPNPDRVLLGRPLLNQQLYVLDSVAQPVPIGVPGELYIGGHGVVRGYHRRPELSAERFVKDPFQGEGARMYRTGDLVRFREDGSLEFLGRTDHQVKIRGHRIELGEIETRLTSHAGVDEGVVIAREDTPGDQRLVAYYTGRASEDELRRHIKQTLPEFMVPAVFVLLPRMPHTPNGKIDRKLLPAPERQRRAVEVAKPESEVETKVAALWQEVLGIDQVGMNDNFFDLGGHSLLVVRLHQLLKKALNPSIPMTSLYRFPTIRGFVQNLSGGDKSDAAEQARDRGQARREQLSRMRGNRPRPR
jgi:acyl-coenzyme A synthetase/AMP-(fatty) acid ligase/acyl carrier protein